MLEKYAVGQGGGHNHRLGLFDRIMIKDNHVAADGATADERLRALVGRARAARPDLLVEVEVDRPDQVEPVLAAGADVILLDQLHAAAAARGGAAHPRPRLGRGQRGRRPGDLAGDRRDRARLRLVRGADAFRPVGRPRARLALT